MAARSRQRWLVYSGALAVPALVLFRRLLFGGETLVERDLQSFYRASRAIFVRLLGEPGWLPMWNPWFASGQPFAANPENQLFHPLTWLFAVFPFEWAFRLQVVVPVLLSAAGMGFLLLTLGRSRAAALFGALSWAYGGYLLSATNLMPALFGVVGVPVFLACFVRIARAPSAASAAGAGLAFGWMLLSGEVMTLAVALAAPAALAHGWVARGALGARPARGRSPVKVVAALAGAFVLGLSIGAGTLVPGSLLFKKTVRAEGLTAEAALSWSLAPERLFELAVPNLLGHARGPAHEEYWGRSRYPVERGPFLYSIYPGLLVLAAAAAAWARRRTLEHAWAAVAALGFLLAIGRHFFLWPLARETVPLLDGFRFPEKLSFLLVLGVTVSASAGFDLLLRRRRRALAVAGAVVAAGAVAGLATAASALDLPSLYPGNPEAAREALGRLARADGRALVATAAAGLAALAFLARRGRRLGAPLLVLVLGAELSLRGSELLRSRPASEVDAAPSWVRKILARNDPEGRVFHSAQWFYTREEIWNLFMPPPMPAYWGLRLTLENDFDRTELAWSAEATATAKAAFRNDPRLLEPILERRGVGAIVRLHHEARLVPEGVVQPAELDSPLDVDLYVEKARLAFLAETLRTARDAKDWARELRALGPAAGRAAIVDAAGPPLPSPPGRGEVSRFSVKPGRIEADLRCDGPQPCFLALTETWDENWSATLDGKPAAIRRSDLSLMGLPVPTGTHAVVVTYDDPSVRLGASFTSLGGLVGLLLVATGLGRRSSRARPPAAAPDAGASSPPPSAPRPAPGAKAARRRPKR